MLMYAQVCHISTKKLCSLIIFMTDERKIAVRSISNPKSQWSRDFRLGMNENVGSQKILKIFSCSTATCADKIHIYVIYI